MATKNWELEVEKKWFDAIKSGDKKWEGRRFISINKFTPDHTVTFFHTNGGVRIEEVSKKIVEMRWFKDYEDALKTLPLRDVLPGVVATATQTVEKVGEEIYMSYNRGNPRKMEELLLGVCFIRLE